jgi:formylglycine-generating enzyme required for sulfatase activity
LLLASAAVIARPYVLSLAARGEMVPLSGGYISVGYALDSDAIQNEQVVTVLPFEIEKYEVANRQYRLCVDAGACSPPVNAEEFDTPAKAEYPVIGITSYQAEHYCQWIGRRLPTDAEWIFAAAGSSHRLWPWGNELPTADKANLLDASPGMQAITSFPRGQSEEGVFNLIGNVWEYTSTASPDSGGKAVILRGGGWQNSLASMFVYVPIARTEQSNDIGARCAKS